MEETTETSGLDLADRGVAFEVPVQMELPARQCGTSYRNSVFEYPGKLNKEEAELATDLDGLNNLRCWYRNADKGEFALQGYRKTRFNPDFIAFTNSGKIAVLEWKGADRISADDAQYKLQLGNPSLDSEAGLRAAYDALGGELYRMAHRALNDDGLAEEAVQETFLRAWRAADRYDPERSSLRTWMFAIARNVTIDLARARSARPQRTGQEVEHTQAAKDTVEESLRSTYYRDRPCAEVAAEAGVPVGTMRSRLYYGLKALRLVLEEREWTG